MSVPRWPAARVLGVTCCLVSLLFYRSDVNRPILGLWSYPFFGVIVAVCAWWSVSLARWWRARRSAARSGGLSAESGLLDLAILGWGLAYALGSRFDRAEAGRLADLVWLGSPGRFAPLLEWVALGLAMAAAGVRLARTLGARRANLALAAGAIAVFAWTAEGIVRVVVCVRPATRGFPTYSGREWERRYTRRNTLGFRDRDHARDAKPGVARLLVVGDSFAYGVGIEREQDRFGEQVSAELTRLSGSEWESLNASVADTHTLDHIGFLEKLLPFDPDVILLLYVFNDIDYLAPVTRRTAMARTVAGRLHPLWLVYRNSYAFQEIYVRWRQLEYRHWMRGRGDPYLDGSLLGRHLSDLSRFISEAAAGGALVRIVPFDVLATEVPASEERYRHFVEECERAGLAVCPVLDAFSDRTARELQVNSLDSHPNELAHHLAAVWVAARLAEEIVAERAGG